MPSRNAIVHLLWENLVLRPESRLELTAATVTVPANRILLSEKDILVDHVADWSDSMAA